MQISALQYENLLNQSEERVVRELTEQEHKEAEERIRQRTLEALKQCEEDAKKKRLEFMQKYSILRTMPDYLFENYIITKDNADLYNLCKRYSDHWEIMQSENIGLLLMGVPGNGKTFATACIANELHKQDVLVVMDSSIAILDRVKETYQKYGDLAESELIEIYNYAELLIIDDLGAESDTNWTTQELYKLIDARYRARKPLIITTNLSKEELQNKLSRRTFDRLVEMCQVTQVSGKSRRIESGERKQRMVEELIREKMNA